jgi:hypothetical protein
MKKTTHESRRTLEIHKETIRTLSPAELPAVAGGKWYSTSDGWCDTTGSGGNVCASLFTAQTCTWYAP